MNPSRKLVIEELERMAAKWQEQLQLVEAEEKELREKAVLAIRLWISQLDSIRALQACLRQNAEARARKDLQ